MVGRYKVGVCDVFDLVLDERGVLRLPIDAYNTRKFLFIDVGDYDVNFVFVEIIGLDRLGKTVAVGFFEKEYTFFLEEERDLFFTIF